MFKTRFVSSLAVLLLLCGIAWAQDPVEKKSNNDFNTTIRKLDAALRAANLMVLGEYDYQKMQRMVGKTVRPNKGYAVFRPDLGIPIFESDPRASLEIPLKLNVIDTGGGIILRYRRPSDVLGKYPGLSDLGKRLDDLVNQIVDAATK